MHINVTLKITIAASDQEGQEPFSYKDFQIHEHKFNDNNQEDFV